MIYLLFFVTKSFAWIFFPRCFCALSSTKAFREYCGFFQSPPLTVNDPTLKYLKLQMTLTILSLIREMSLRIYTFKTATSLSKSSWFKSIWVFQLSESLRHAILHRDYHEKLSSFHVSHLVIYANFNTECIVWRGL